MAIDRPLRVVGLVPGRARAGRERLIAALEAAFPVRFEDRDPGAWRDLDAAVVMNGDTAAGEGAAAAGLPTLAVLDSGSRVEGPGADIRFGRDEQLDPRLRGQTLRDERAGLASPVPMADGDAVLASSGEGPLWILRRNGAAPLDIVSLPPQGLGREEPLRHELQAGRFLGLLPLVHFLRRLSADEGWTPPRLRAAFIIDDPNLHWTSYGYLRYRELARHAQAHGYHVAFAMVPLDGRLTHPAAARLFRNSAESLSLLTHGNDHLRRELAQRRPEAEAYQLLAQALRRVAAFERRSGVPVARVMAPPHGACSEQSAACMLGLGFDAMCVTRPYPWREGPPANRPLADWAPAELVAGGLPILPRHRLEWSRDDLVLRAFLDQPLVLYGHHGDVAGGLDALGEAAAELGRLGEIRWCSLAEIARSNFTMRREGSMLALRLFSRRARVELPDGVEALTVELPAVDGELRLRTVACGPSRSALAASRFGYSSELLPVPSPGLVEVVVEVADAVDPRAIPRPRWRPWPIARRRLAEGRDRLLPLLRR